MATARRLPTFVMVTGTLHAFVLVLVLHRQGGALGHGGETALIDPVGHWARDSLLYLPVGVALLAGATLLARRLTAGPAMADDGPGAVLLWAGLGAVASALAGVPGGIVHGALLNSLHTEAPSMWQAGQQAVLTLRYSFALLVAVAMVAGLPWAPRRRAQKPSAPSPCTPATTARGA